MTVGRSLAVDRASIRVALGTSAIVALVYLVVAFAVVTAFIVWRTSTQKR